MDIETSAAIAAGIVGAGRLLTGVAFLAKPRPITDRWVGDSGVSTAYLARAVGGRDALIGAGILWAVFADASVIPWLLVSVGADLTDAGASAMLGRERRKRTIAMAGGFALLGAVATAFAAAA